MNTSDLKEIAEGIGMMVAIVLGIVVGSVVTVFGFWWALYVLFGG